MFEASYRKNIFLVFNLTILAGLALFGTHFSKLQLAPNIYLHDLLLIVGATTSLFFHFKNAGHLPTLLILSISLIYLTISIQFFTTPIELILRQFALFAYLGGYYFLNLESLSHHSTQLIKKFLIGIAIFSVLTQIGTVLYYQYHGEFDPFNYKNHYWFSPATAVGLIISAAIALVCLSNKLFKISSIIIILLLTWTTGHASAQLGVIAIVFIYFVIKLWNWKKIIPIVVGIAVTALLVEKAPQFKDSNSDWRLLVWNYHLTSLAKDKYLILGNGFGMPYINSELEVYLYEQISSTALQEIGKSDERYLSPPHNSFITILFAIGFLPGLLIFQPFLKIPSLVLSNNKLNEFDAIILLCLIGLAVWCSLNVVLEVPHTAGFFWLIYFTFAKLKPTVGDPLHCKGP